MFNLLELIVWGHKSQTYRSMVSGKKRQRRRAPKLVLNERAQMKLYAKLRSELPRDIAVSVLNDIKQFSEKI